MGSWFILTMEHESVDLVYVGCCVAHHGPTNMNTGINTWRYGTALSLQQAIYLLAQCTSVMLQVQL
jgi:hypothetical protein